MTPGYWLALFFLALYALVSAWPWIAANTKRIVTLAGVILWRR